MVKYLNLIRKITWSFHQTTGIEWDELFSEASLAYCEAINSYDETKKSKESSWVFTCIESQLKNFCKYELRNKNIDGFIREWAADVEYTPDYEFYSPDRFKDVSDDVRSIIFMLILSPKKYIKSGEPPRSVFGKIRKDLKSVLGWTWPRIDKGLASFRIEVMNTVR